MAVREGLSSPSRERSPVRLCRVVDRLCRAGRSSFHTSTIFPGPQTTPAPRRGGARKARSRLPTLETRGCWPHRVNVPRSSSTEARLGLDSGPNRTNLQTDDFSRNDRACRPRYGEAPKLSRVMSDLGAGRRDSDVLGAGHRPNGGASPAVSHSSEFGHSGPGSRGRQGRRSRPVSLLVPPTASKSVISPPGNLVGPSRMSALIRCVPYPARSP